MNLSRKTGVLALVVVCAALRTLAPGSAAAQGVRSRILAGMQLDEDDQWWTLRIEFTTPVQQLRHSPASFGDLLEIQLNLVVVSTVDAPFALVRESLRVPPGLSAPVRSIEYDGSMDGGPFLFVRFTRPVEFRVDQEKDFRAVLVRIRRPRPPSRSPLEPPPLPPPADSSRFPAPTPGPGATGVPPLPAEDQAAMDHLLDQAREALTAGELERAILILTKALGYPENPRTPEAKELLGVARQRNGQLAHAKAEYQEYLERYPEGEGAARVRQRLEALVTAREREREKLPEARRTLRNVRFDGYGSLFTSYFRSEALQSELDIDDPVRASDSFSDVFLVGRADHPSWSVQTQLSGSYRYDLAGSTSDFRASTLLLDVGRPDRSLFGIAGRQSMSTRGVLGRFDGGRATWRFLDAWDVTAVGGFPVDTFDQTGVDTSKVFYGLSLGGERLFDAVDGYAFAIGQTAYGVMDRLAVGGELRYASDGQLVLGFVDYDVYYTDLNTAFVLGNFALGDDTQLNLQADYRNTPVLTTANALIGQPVNGLDELRRTFSLDEIRALARDRTAKVATASLGASHRLDETYQLAGDVTLSDFFGTDASGGVVETESTGWELSYFAQVIASDLFLQGGVQTLGLRYFDGNRTDAVSLLWNARLPGFDGLWTNPRLVVSVRNLYDDRRDVLVRPALRFELRRWNARFEAEAGLDALYGLGAAAASDDLGYTLNIGVRIDF